MLHVLWYVQAPCQLQLSMHIHQRFSSFSSFSSFYSLTLSLLLSFLDAPPLTHTIQSPWCCVQSLLSYLPPLPSRPLFFPSFSFPPFLILVLFLLLPSYSSPSPISSIIPPSLPPLPFPSLPSFFFSSSVILPDIPYPLLPLHPLHAPLHTTLLLITSTKRWRTRVSFPSILPTPRLAFTSDSNTTTINFQGYTFLQLHSSSLIIAIHSFLSTFPPSFFPYLLPFISPFLSSSSLHLSLLATRHSLIIKSSRHGWTGPRLYRLSPLYWRRQRCCLWWGLVACPMASIQQQMAKLKRPRKREERRKEDHGVMTTNELKKEKRYICNISTGRSIRIVDWLHKSCTHGCRRMLTMLVPSLTILTRLP